MGPLMPCGELVAEMLAVPFVITLRVISRVTSPVGSMNVKDCGKLSPLPCYVPVYMTGLTDRMTFLERVKNTMFSVFFDFWI